VNVISFYEQLCNNWDIKKLDGNLFVNPLVNHVDFDDIQFIYANGSICPPLNPKAESVYFSSPLNGPFYRLKAEGFVLDKGWKRGLWLLHVVASFPDDKLSYSAAIILRGNEKKILKVLNDIIGKSRYTKEKIKDHNELVQDSRLQLPGGHTESTSPRLQNT